MFDMDALLSELDQENAALESLISDLDVAEEGLFSKPKSADQLLAKVQKTVDKKCKTVEDAQAMLDKLNGEKKKYNDALKKMKDAAVQFKDGKIDKKGLQAIIKPAAKELKKTCEIINITEINTNKTDDITDEEVQKLRDFLTGAEQILADKIASFGGSSEGDTSGSGNCEGEDCGAEESCKKKACAEESCKKKACEGYDGAFEALLNIDEGEVVSDEQLDVATEAAAEGVAIGAAIASYAAIIALALRGPKGDRAANKYIKKLQKYLKPELKSAKYELKKAKASKDWSGCIAALKKTIKLNETIISEAKSLGTEYETKIRKNSDGSSSEDVKRQFSLKVQAAIDKAKQEILNAKALIKQYELKAKGSPSAMEAAYIEGFNAAMEALSDDDDDVSSEFSEEPETDIDEDLNDLL